MKNLIPKVEHLFDGSAFAVSLDCVLHLCHHVHHHKIAHWAPFGIVRLVELQHIVQKLHHLEFRHGEKVAPGRVAIDGNFIAANAIDRVKLLEVELRRAH